MGIIDVLDSYHFDKVVIADIPIIRRFFVAIVFDLLFGGIVDVFDGLSASDRRWLRLLS